MRQVRVPVPALTWELACEGPIAPPAVDAEAALARLDDALTVLPRLDRALGSDAWTVVWSSAVLEPGPRLKAWLWCARPGRDAELVRALAPHLEAAGFAVRPAYRHSRADPGLFPRVVYLRDGPVGLGLERRTRDLLDAVRVVEEDRDDVDLGLQYRFRAQRCPSCRVDDVPLALVAGFPSRELLLAVELGEVALAGCDPRARKNARCRHCGADFVAR